MQFIRFGSLSLKKFIQRQQPLTISLVSFLLMLAVVTTIGLVGGNHIVAYLQKQLMEHGLGHNREVIQGILPLLERPLEDGVAPERVVEEFQRFVAHAGPFGVRLFLIDRRQRSVIADSGGARELPYSLDGLLDTEARALDGTVVRDVGEWSGPAWRLTREGAVKLMLFQPVGVDAGEWTLGVSSDFSELLNFMDELHLHLDSVLLFTYGLIGLLGFLMLRWVGRRYESGLEEQIRLRTGELETAHQRLLEQARLATIGQTASVLAHEMRNPLASMKLALSGLLRAERMGERERQRLDLVLGEVDRLDDMLSETLDYVRPVVREGTPASLDVLLDEVLELEGPFLREQGIELQRIRCPECPPLLMDRPKMRQVLLNLLKNAREASPPGSVVKVALQQREGEVELSIANGGGPLPDEVREHAFDFFFTTRARGTGLGLGLVKRVVEEHGGEVALEGEGEWIRVRVRLPCGADPRASDG